MRQLLCIGSLLLLLAGCSEQACTQQFFAMDTTMSITAYGSQAQDAVLDAVTRINALESLLSRTREDSDITRLNAAAPDPAAVSDETAFLLEFSRTWWEKTGGAFDITVAPLVAAWGFAGGGEHRVPSSGELESLLTLVDGGGVTVDGDTAALARAGMAVDLGGIAKGYAADQARTILENAGVTSALLQLGGSVTAVGSNPDGSPWRVGVTDPSDPSAMLGVLLLEDTSAVTSGGYQRYFTQNGVTYHHIIDPETGYPADSGLLSVTVVCSNATLADLLSTAAFVLGEEDALDLWRAEGGFELLLVTEDGRIVATSGLEDLFSLELNLDAPLEIVC